MFNIQSFNKTNVTHQYDQMQYCINQQTLCKFENIFFVVKVGMPEGEITMEIFTNNISLGKTKFNICNKMDNFSSLVSDLVNPLEFFLQALDCDDTDSLDRELVDILTNGSMGNNPLAGLEAVDFRDSIWGVCNHTTRY